MKTAVIGASGFLGSRLLRHYRTRYPDCVGTCWRRRQPGLIPWDLGAPDVAPLRLLETGHESVIVAAGRTGIDACERDSTTDDVNVRGTLELLESLGRLDLYVIYLSTDNVFDGRTGGYSEQSRPRPPMRYGRQKLQVEREIASLCPRHAVLRLSKVFGVERGDATLLQQLAEPLATGRSVDAAWDLRFNPTYVEDVVGAVEAVQRADARGLIHVAAPEVWSRYELAVAMADALRVDRQLVRRVALADLPGFELRPRNTSLDCPRWRAEFKTEFRPVQECITQVAADWFTDHPQP